MSRCFSKCRSVSKADCKPPKCAYTNGATRKYCRLNTKKYYLDNKCNATRKKTDAALHINRFINKHRNRRVKESPKKKRDN